MVLISATLMHFLVDIYYDCLFDFNSLQKSDTDHRRIVGGIYTDYICLSYVCGQVFSRV